LTVVRARADAARGKLIQAGLYLNPTLSLRSDEMNNPNGRLGFPALTLTQEFVTARKIKLAKAAAAQGVAAADWDAVTRWFDVATRVRIAYTDVLTTQLEVRANSELVRIAEEGLAVAVKLEKAGAGSQPDVLRARVQLEQSRMQLGVAQRRAEAARRILAVAVGVAELPPTEVQGNLEVPAPVLEWTTLLGTVLTRSSEVQAAEALASQADRLLASARAQAVPNFYIQARAIYSDPDRSPEAMIEIGAPVPLYNRNQGNIASARADVARTRAEVRQVELALTARLSNAFQRYQAARQQAEAYEKGILRHAQESLRLVRLGYDRGEAKYDYTAVLQAQLILFQARLAYVQTLGEVWRAVSEIGGLMQENDFNVGEAPPPQTCPEEQPIPSAPDAPSARAVLMPPAADLETAQGLLRLQPPAAAETPRRP
jgi:cobalt-zinc-cadmium efflux system outer membrane protein